jgi:predicted adenylyl cyclase CyaB
MSILNIEIKARCHKPEQIRKKLTELGADYKGTDHQVDTYFKVPDGRLKLRQGSIEQNLIFYRRPNSKSPKASDINLVPAEHPEQLLALLTNALEIKVIVDKQRDIYFIRNVKFHVDEVKELGHFVEIEAIDDDNTIGEAKLRQQCQKYMDTLNIAEQDLVADSYSDLLMDS